MPMSSNNSNGNLHGRNNEDSALNTDVDMKNLGSQQIKISK
jgi:hypothetical protein